MRPLLPILPDNPEGAAAFVLGSVLPDIDALSRCFGRRAFLRFHQTYTHSLPVACEVGVASGATAGVWGMSAASITCGLTLGMIGHSLLDYTNTYGITLWSPFRRKRRCTSWVFFIDAPTVLLTLISLALTATGIAGVPMTVGYVSVMALYWWSPRDDRTPPFPLCTADTVSLLPTAFVPWRFLGASQAQSDVRLFALDARHGDVTYEATVTTEDDQYRPLLESLPEFRQMRGLSPLYHVVNVEKVAGGHRIISCRDLRTRNFRTHFGDLTVRLDADGDLTVLDWAV